MAAADNLVAVRRVLRTVPRTAPNDSSGGTRGLAREAGASTFSRFGRGAPRCRFRGRAVGVGMVVRVRVRVVMSQIDVGHDLDPSVLDPAHRQDLVGDCLQPVGFPADDDDLQAVSGAQVNVHRGTDTVAQLVLELGQLLAQVPHVVVVDDGQGRDGIDTGSHLGPDHLGTREIAEHLGTGTAPFDHQFVELSQQWRVYRDAKTDQGGAHGR